MLIRDAATVMLVRDAPALEVFMLRRNLNSDFVGGAYVFPGGGVDEEDRNADLGAIAIGRTDAEASSRLGIASGGLAYWVAAIRECFEEAGVLLASDSETGEIADFTEPEVAARFVEHRRAVNAGERKLAEIIREEDLVFDVGNIHYFAHWITPPGPPRRYDARFFVAAAPKGQVPLHDDRETVASIWIRPAEALERSDAGDFQLIFPTIRNLQAISEYESSQELLDAARAVRSIVTVRPRIASSDGGMRLLIPGDDGYEDAVEPSGEMIPGLGANA